MDSFSVIQKAIFSENLSISETFEDAVNIHQFLRKDKIVSEKHASVQFISDAISDPKKKFEAFVLLDMLFKQSSLENIEENANLWLPHVIGTCNAKDLARVSDKFYRIIEFLAKVCKEYQELFKKFSTSYLPRIYETIQYTTAANCMDALKLIMVLLEEYPGPSKSYVLAIQSFLKKFIESTNEDISSLVGQCYLLLQLTRGLTFEGSNRTSVLINYQLDLIQVVDSTIDTFFEKNSLNRNTLNIISENNQFRFVNDNLHKEPSKKMGQLYVRFSNAVLYLREFLRYPLRTPKPILMNRVLATIQKGNSVNPIQLQQTGVLENLIVSYLVPKIQIVLFDLLINLVELLENHIKLYSNVVLEIIIETLRWTSSKNVNYGIKPFSSLRIKVFHFVSIWCTILQSGSMCESVAETLLSEIFTDISVTKPEITLKVLSGTRKHMTKKARRQLQIIGHNQFINKNSVEKTNLLHFENGELCTAALKCLNDFLMATTNFLKPSIIKTIQIKLLEVSSLLYDLPLTKSHLYFNENCRKQILLCLYTVATVRHHLCPPPFELIVHALQTARLLDSSFEVRTQCTNLLSHIEIVVHPRKSCLFYPTNMQDVKNAFIIMGQEKLIQHNNFVSDTFTSLCHQDVENKCTNEKGNSDVQAEKSMELPPSIVRNSNNVNRYSLENKEPAKMSRTALVTNQYNCEYSRCNKKIVKCKRNDSAGVDDNLFPSLVKKNQVIDVNGDTQKCDVLESNPVNVEDTYLFSKKLKIDDQLIADIEAEFVDELA